MQGIIFFKLLKERIYYYVIILDPVTISYTGVSTINSSFNADKTDWFVEYELQYLSNSFTSVKQTSISKCRLLVPFRIELIIGKRAFTD